MLEFLYTIEPSPTRCVIYFACPKQAFTCQDTAPSWAEKYIVSFSRTCWAPFEL